MRRALIRKQTEKCIKANKLNLLLSARASLSLIFSAMAISGTISKSSRRSTESTALLCYFSPAHTCILNFKQFKPLRASLSEKEREPTRKRTPKWFFAY